MGIPAIRCEIAFTTAPSDPAPAFQDVTQYLSLANDVTITRGRPDEFGTIQAGTASFTLDNTDGRFTAGNTASPYYPNVKIRKKVRLTYRDPAVAGNMVPDPSFELGIGSWVGAGTPSPAVAVSTAFAHSGTQSMRVTWAAGNTFVPSASLLLSGLVLGRKYVYSAYVYVPAGNPAVRLIAGQNGLLTAGAYSSINDAWQRISTTFTATAETHSFLVSPNGTPTAGQLCYVDDVMADEGSTVAAFTASALSISYRFTGYVEEWPVEWPGGSAFSEVQVSAVDRFKRLGQLAQFRSVIEQEYLYDNPFAYYTLGDAAASTLAGDTSKNGMASLAISQVASGGTLSFGNATGPATDGLTALQLVPANPTGGKYLSGFLGQTSASYGYAGHTIECFFLSSLATAQDFLCVTGTGTIMRLAIDSTGHLAGNNVFGCLVTSSTVVTNGATHHAALVESVASTTVTLALYLDGALVGTSTASTAYGTLFSFSGLQVGGSTLSAFNGTLAHAACYDVALPAARIADHAAAGFTGFAGERSDQRLSRYARWAGVPVAEQSLEVGASTSIAFVDTTGVAPVQAMQDVTSTESGILQIDGRGRLAFQARTHRYNAASVLSLDGVIDPSAKFIANDAYLRNDITASRPNGITYRAVNADSINDYGTAADTLTLLTTSDNEVMDAANWKANQTAVPSPRLPSLIVDILSRPTLQAAVLALDTSSRVTVTMLPTQAPASSIDLFIEGSTETISADYWRLAFNTSPAAASGVWQLDSPTYSQLGVSTRLAY